MRQVEIYRPNRQVESLEYLKSLSGNDVLPGFVLDLPPIFDVSACFSHYLTPELELNCKYIYSLL
jgi:hypothetical protein